MEKLIFHSMAEHINEAVDCNTIYFQIEFCHVPIEAAKASAVAFCNMITELHQDQFISVTQICGLEKRHRTVPIKEIGTRLNECELPSSVIIEANVKSRTIGSSAQFRNFLNNIRFEKVKLVNSDAALDFSPYYQASIEQNLTNLDKLSQAINKLIEINHQESINYCSRPDSTGLFCSHFDFPGKSHCSGSMDYSIMLECLEKDSVAAFADYLVKGMQNICGLLGMAGGRVGFCPFPMMPWTNPYMFYFGWNEPVRTEDFNDSIPEHTFYRYWMKIYYSCGCDWANILSPYAAKKIMQRGKNFDLYKDLQCECLKEGSLLVRWKKDIFCFQHNEMMQMKEFLYPSLYPGWRSFLIPSTDTHIPPSHWVIRSFWENAPVFSDEFEIIGKRVIFKLRNTVSTCDISP